MNLFLSYLPHALLLLLWTTGLKGDISIYRTHQIHHNEVVGTKFAAVLPGSSIFAGPAPTLTIDASIQQNLNLNGTTTEMLLFHALSHPTFGIDSGIGFCCTTEYYQKGLCDNPGELAIDFTTVKLFAYPEKSYLRADSLNAFYWPPQSDQQVWKFHEKIRLPYSGLWYFIIANCYENNTSESLDTTLTFTNPFGFLSGAVFPRVPVHLSLVTAYFGLLMVWLGLMFTYRKNLVRMQYVMLFAIFMGFIHELIWSTEWYLYNTTGAPYHLLALIGALLTTVKLTVIRTLILLIAIGYSILCETLEILPKLGVIVLTLAYGTFLGTSEYLNVLKEMGYFFTDSTMTGLFAILTIFNAIFSIWIFYSLRVNIKNLQQQKVKSKRQRKMYIEMSYGLLVAGIACLVTFVAERVMSFLKLEDQQWSSWWLFFAFWEYLYFFLTSFVSFVWRPNANNLKFDINYKSLASRGETDSSSSASPSFSEPHMVARPPLQPDPPPMYRYKKEPGSPSFRSESTIARIGDVVVNDQKTEMNTEELDTLLFKVVPTELQTFDPNTQFNDSASTKDDEEEKKQKEDGDEMQEVAL